MEKIGGINLNQLVEEARISLKSEKMRLAKKSIRHVIQGIETTEKKNHRNEKRNREKRKEYRKRNEKN